MQKRRLAAAALAGVLTLGVGGFGATTAATAAVDTASPVVKTAVDMRLYLAVDVPPSPPSCKLQKQVRYVVGLSPAVKWIRFPRPAVAISMTKETWYSPQYVYKPFTRIPMGIAFRYEAHVVGETFGIPLPTDKTVMCWL